jgi:DNA-binding MarR family transcriptional regulator
VIADTPGISGAELARRCLVTPQTMTTVLGNLTVKGLIERRTVPGQGRAMETTVTPAGKRLLGRADKKVVEVEELLNAQLTKADQQTLHKLLEKCRVPFSAVAPVAEEKTDVQAPAARPARKTAKKAPATKKTSTATAKKAPAAKKTARAKKV